MAKNKLVNLLTLTDDELIDLYEHSQHFRSMVENMITFCKVEYSEDITTPEAIEQILDNLDGCADDWVIIVSGYDLIEIGFNYHDKKIDLSI